MLLCYFSKVLHTVHFCFQKLWACDDITNWYIIVPSLIFLHYFSHIIRWADGNHDVIFTACPTFLISYLISQNISAFSSKMFHFHHLWRWQISNPRFAKSHINHSNCLEYLDFSMFYDCAQLHEICAEKVFR